MITQAIILITMLEGFSPVPYKDAHGYSIGYGHFIQEGENIARVTHLDARRMLENDLKGCASFIETLALTEPQGASVASFCYNVGLTATKKSTMVKLIRSGADDYIVSDEFDRWVFSSGSRNEGLVKRRHIEKEHFLGMCLLTV